jgi:hypothetical protein
LKPEYDFSWSTSKGDAGASPWDNSRPETFCRNNGACYLRGKTPRGMVKRFVVMVVGAGMGSLAGLLISVMGAGNAGLIGGAVVGALLPLFVLGPPGPQSGK